MSEYPPATTAPSLIPASEVAAQRAKLVLANRNISGNKRPLEDGKTPNSKKLAGLDGSGDYQTGPGSMGSGAIGVGSRVSGAPNMSQQALPEQSINEYIRVPDKMVGLIIGRGGEQISRLQAESGCKIQMAPDSGGQPDRVCTLTGTPDAVAKAKEMVNAIVNQRGRDGMPPDGGSGQQRVNQNYISKEEIMIPGPKVGLIIGKGGETIKQLQEKSGAKMVVIQDGPNPEHEKPLRITGDPQKVEYAKHLVYELIMEKESQFGGPRGNRPNKAGNNSAPWGGHEDDYDQNNPDAQERRDQDGNRQPGRGMPRNGGGSYGSWGGPQDNKIEVSFTVASDKCGIIIGRRGEVIKQINAQSGAHCELDRRTQNNHDNRTFYIRGTPENVEAAKRIIIDKVGMPVTFMDSNGVQGNDGGSGGGNVVGGNNSNAGDYGAAYGSGQGPPSSGGPVGSGSGGGVAMWGYNPHWHTSQQQQPESQPQQQSVPINPVTGQPDYSQQWIDYYRSLGMLQEAENIEQQQKASKAAAAAAAVVAVATGGQQPTTQHSQAAVVSANGTNAVTPGVANVASGGNAQPQPDYSAQWAEYYRKIGKIKEAEAVETQMKQKAAALNAGGTPSTTAANVYAGGAPYQPQPYQQQQHYPGYSPYPGYPTHQPHPAPSDQQQ